MVRLLLGKYITDDTATSKTKMAQRFLRRKKGRAFLMFYECAISPEALFEIAIDPEKLS